jgi:hypothetical protein
VFTLSERINDQDEVDEGEEDDVELFNSGEDAAEAFQPAEEPFHFIALLVEFAVVIPRIEAETRSSRS